MLSKASLLRRPSSSSSPSCNVLKRVKSLFGFQRRWLTPRSPACISHPPTCGVIGAPITLGQPLVGVEHGPTIMRKQGLRQKIATEGWRVVDYGDIDYANIEVDSSRDSRRARHSVAVGRMNELLHESTYKHAKDGEFCLVLGGDHTVGIGSVAGLLRARPDMGVIWVDAHADINTPATSPTKNIHGMAVAFLMQLSNPTEIAGFEWMDKVPALKPSQIVYIALRDLEAAEKDVIHDMGIKAFSMHEVDRYGIGKVLEMTHDHLQSHGCDTIHLSFDIDSVDPYLAPSTGTTVRGGLTFREAHFVCESVHGTGLLASLDMVEVNPSLAPGDGADQTADMATRLIVSAMGDSIIH